MNSPSKQGQISFFKESLLRIWLVLYAFSVLLLMSACSSDSKLALVLNTEYKKYESYYTKKLVFPVKDGFFIYAGSAVVGNQIAVLGHTSDGYQIVFFDENGNSLDKLSQNFEISDNETVLSFSSNNDGKIVVVTLREEPNLDEDNSAKSEIVVYTIGEQGNQKGSPIVISDDFGQVVPEITVSTDGKIYAFYSGKLSVYERNGKNVYNENSVYVSGVSSVGNSILINEQVRDKVGNDHRCLCAIEPEKLAAPIRIDQFMERGITLSGCIDGLFAHSSLGIYAYNFELGQMDVILEWANSNTPINYQPNNIHILSKDKILATAYADSGSSDVLLIMPGGEIKDDPRQIVTLAGCGINNDYFLKPEIDLFNKSNEKYRIVVTDYSVDLSSVDQEPKDKMKLDLIAGNIADLYFYRDAELDSQCQENFLDLNILAGNDKDFHKTDYFWNIIELCKTDGVLSKIPFKYKIIGWVAPQSLIGARTGWTLDEYNAIADALPEGVCMFKYGNTLPSQYLSVYLSQHINDFIDPSSGKINLETEYFYDILKYAENSVVDDESQTIATTSTANEWALTTLFISSGVRDYEELMAGGSAGPNMGFSEPVSFVGDPAKTASGAQAVFEQFLSVSKNSTVPEGAWAFIKFLLSEEAQVEATQHAIDGPEGIPVLKSALSAEIETALHPEDVDRFAPISQECADGYLALINSINSIYSLDHDIYNIVTEDSPPYYLGQKSAQDVAAVMQSRMQILLDERK